MSSISAPEKTRERASKARESRQGGVGQCGSDGEPMVRGERPVQRGEGEVGGSRWERARRVMPEEGGFFNMEK